MKEESYRRAKEIEKEITTLMFVKGQVKRNGVIISIDINNERWAEVKNVFDRKSWEKTLQGIIVINCDERIEFLENEFKNL
jgi:predicted O-methyltransferase YrrM